MSASASPNVQMAERTPDDVRVTVLDEPATARHETPPAPREDVENQNGHRESDADVRSPLLSPGRGGVGTGGSPVATEPESLALMEIQALLWIKAPGNEVFREALETWQAKDALFASRVDKKKKQSSSLRNEIYQLVGFYSVFQGVLLTAVAQSNYLTCHNWWTAFSLSLLASLVTVGGVLQKFHSVILLEKTIASESYSRMLCIGRVNKLLQQRENFSFQRDAGDPDQSKRPPAQTGLEMIFPQLLQVYGHSRRNRRRSDGRAILGSHRVWVSTRSVMKLQGLILMLPCDLIQEGDGSGKNPAVFRIHLGRS